MKSKILKISISLMLILMLPLTSFAVGGEPADDSEDIKGEVDINHGANTTLIPCTGACDSSWPAPMQGMRITLVYSDEAVTTQSCDIEGEYCSSVFRVTKGERVRNYISIKTISSVDYSNHYSSLNRSSVKYFGYNSKLDYLKGSIFVPKTGYVAYDPPGSLPNFISAGSGVSTVLEDYFRNTYLNLNNEPYNLRKLMVNLGAVDFVTTLDYYGGYVNGKFTKKIKQKEWKQLETYYPYAFLIEPILYIDITNTPNVMSTVYNSRVAMTATEAGILYKNLAIKEDTETRRPVECFACGVTLRDLPRSIYTLDIHFAGTSNEIIGYNNDNFPTDLFDAANKYMYSGTIFKKNGVGVGYAAVFKYINEVLPDPVIPPTPEPPAIVVPEPTPVPVPVTNTTCKVGSCGKPPYFKDDSNWANIIGNPAYLDGSKGSSFSVTDWKGSTNVLNYSTTTTPTNKKLLCPVYCRNEVTTNFPSTPSGGLAAGTNFQYSPVSTSTYRECQANIELELWQKDVAETEKRLEESERQLGRVQRKQAVWIDVSDNGVVNNGGGSIASSTFCRTETQSRTPQLNELKVNKSESCEKIKVYNPEIDDFVFIDRCSTTYNYTLTCVYNGNVFSRTASSVVTADGRMLTPNPLPSQTRTFGKLTMVTSASINAGGASGTANCSVSEEVEVGKKYTWNYQYFDLNYPYGQDPINKLITYQPTYVSIPGISDSNVYCAGEGDYSAEVTMWRNAVNYYRNRLATLKSSMSNCYNWSANVTTPNISVTQRQNLIGGTTKTNTYNLVVAKTATSGGTVKKSCIDTNGTGICSKTYTNNSGGRIEMYTDVQSSITRKIDYTLPSSTNRYILKPSGEVVSNLPAPGVNYIDVGYANYTVAFNSPNNVGSGTMTINYNNLGDHCTGTAGYGRYSCNYKGDEEAEVRSFDFVYHTVDLSNPFSYYQDGSKREPGFNWRYDKTFESKYITNNRGVAGDALYALEPMYVIDFTGENKAKLATIRQYNIANNYSSYKIKCNAGEQCKSDFLRGNIMSGAISGCGLDSNWNSCSGR